MASDAGDAQKQPSMDVKETSLVDEVLAAIRQCRTVADRAADKAASDKVAADRIAAEKDAAEKGTPEGATHTSTIEETSADATAAEKAAREKAAAEKADAEKRALDAEIHDAVEAARKARRRFKSEFYGLADQYRAVLSITVKDRIPSRLAAIAPWTIDLRDIYRRASDKLPAIDEIKIDNVTPGHCADVLSGCLPSAGELTAARSILSKVEAPSKSRWSARLMRSIPSLLALVGGAAFLIVLNRQATKVTVADIRDHAYLAKAAIGAAGSDLDSADALLKLMERDSTWAATVTRASDVPSRLLSAHTLTNTALNALRLTDSIARANGIRGSSPLAVQVNQSMALDTFASQLEKATADTLFRDTAAMRKVRRSWLAKRRDYYGALRQNVVSLACASTLAINLPPSSVGRCVKPDSLLRWAKSGPVRLKSDPFFADGFRGRNREDFVVKMFFALAFLFLGGGLIILLGRLTGIIDSKTTLERIISSASDRDFRSLLTSFPIIAPVGLSAGLLGGYVLAEPSIEREPKPPEIIRVMQVSSPDSSALAQLQTTVEMIRDTVHNISDRAR